MSRKLDCIKCSKRLWKRNPQVNLAATNINIRFRNVQNKIVSGEGAESSAP